MSMNDMQYRTRTHRKETHAGLKLRVKDGDARNVWLSQKLVSP